MYKYFIFFIALISAATYTPKASAGLYIQHAFNYTSDSDNADKFSYGSMKNMFFIGGTLGTKNNFVIGQNVYYWNRNYAHTTNTTGNTLSMLELGPRLIFFFQEEKNFYLSLNYNFYAKGSRTLSGVNQTVDGTSIFFNAGYDFKISRSVFIGVALNYHSLSLTKAEVGSTSTTISNSYVNIYPTLEISFRFR
ncbi:MAG: hypothetical protein U0T83_10415 [Bacteriovoracaceae bacterium]